MMSDPKNNEKEKRNTNGTEGRTGAPEKTGANPGSAPDEPDSGKKKKKKGSVLSVILILVCLSVCLYAGYRLFDILYNYHASSSEYSSLSERFTSSSKPAASEGTAESSGSSASGNSQGNAGELYPPDKSGNSEAGEGTTLFTPGGEGEEPVDPPITVDFNSLKAINPDIVGWIYMEGDPSTSYPICQGSDNDYYLHRTFEGKYLYAGSIFMDYQNSPDFTDSTTILYGHNMKDRSMFGKLEELQSQDVYDEAPYFWIFTPEGSYRYHIFSVCEVLENSDTYTIFTGGGAEFLAWEQNLRSCSMVVNDVPLSDNDHTVILSTCTNMVDEYRLVVIGKCVQATAGKSS